MISLKQIWLICSIVYSLYALVMSIYSTDETTSWWTILKEICKIIVKTYQLAMTIPPVQQWVERLETSLLNKFRNHDTELQEIVVQSWSRNETWKTPKRCSSLLIVYIFHQQWIHNNFKKIYFFLVLKLPFIQTQYFKSLPKHGEKLLHFLWFAPNVYIGTLIAHA